MSLSNGIFILKTRSHQSNDPYEYRVAYCVNIDSLEYGGNHGHFNRKTVQDYFGRSKILLSEKLAWVEASTQYENAERQGCGVLEYGVNMLDYGADFYPELLDLDLTKGTPTDMANLSPR